MTAPGDYFLEIDLKTFSKAFNIPLILRKLGGKIQLKENEFKEIFRTLRGVDVEDLYQGLAEDQRKKIIPYLLEGPEKKSYSFSFRSKMIEDFSVDILAKHIDYFINSKDSFYSDDQNLLSLTQKLLTNSKDIVIHDIFQALDRESSKKELLKALPKDKIAFALSDDNVRIRNFTKKLLGLKAERNINQMNRVRSVVRRILKNAFKGEFEKNKTCNFTLTNQIKTKSEFQIKSIVFEWDSWAISEKNRDDYLSFQLYFGKTKMVPGMKWYQKWHSQIRTELPNLPNSIQKIHSSYYLEKKDYKSLILWIENEMINFIKSI